MSCTPLSKKVLALQYYTQVTRVKLLHLGPSCQLEHHHRVKEGPFDCPPWRRRTKAARIAPNQKDRRCRPCRPRASSASNRCAVFYPGGGGPTGDNPSVLCAFFRPNVGVEKSRQRRLRLRIVRRLVLGLRTGQKRSARANHTCSAWATAWKCETNRRILGRAGWWSLFRRTVDLE